MVEKDGEAGTVLPVEVPDSSSAYPRVASIPAALSASICWSSWVPMTVCAVSMAMHLGHAKASTTLDTYADLFDDFI